MNIRTKLIVMLIVPLAALAAVALWAFRDVNTQSEVLEDTEVSVTAISDLDDLWADLSQERLAVLSGDGIEEAVAETDATIERLAAQTQSGAGIVAQQITDDLPVNRRSTTAAEYSDALDIVEAGISEQPLAGIEADSVLRSIFMFHARTSSRTQEEAWIAVLGEQELRQDQIRDLLVDSRESVAARNQSFADRLSDGARPFADAATIASENDLGELEQSFAVQSTFSGEEVEAIVAQAVSQLSDDEILDTLAQSRASWTDASESTQLGLQADIDSGIAGVDQTRSLAIFVALVGSIMLFTLLFVIGRSITGPLNRLMENAEIVTKDRLPGAVAQLRSLGASDDDVELAPIPKERNDEIGTITDAFNDIQSSALKVATDQARSRRNVAEMFVSLGRRNQQLNQRMIKMISDLQADEQDQETLSELYQLDHVATRMRRNAESLLVLAGNRSPRQWSKSVPFDEVVRSSLAEVEYFERVEIGAVPDEGMSGAVVADITHMLAELLDNATQFSEPSTTVHVTAADDGDAVRVRISDSGFGIDAQDLEALNERVTNPPELDQAPSRLLGLFIVGRLALQHRVHIELESTPGEGTTAIVTIPKSHFPAEVGENPVDVLPIGADPVEINADNAADIFAADLPVEVPGTTEVAESNDLPIDLPVASGGLPVRGLDAADPLAPLEVLPLESPEDTAVDETVESSAAQASASASAFAASSSSGDTFNPLKSDSWPLAQIEPIPDRERPLEAVKRDAQQATDASEDAAVEEVAETPSEPEPSSSLGGLPTRTPQATIETVQTETTVIPLDIVESPASSSAAAPSAFGSFAKGAEKGVDDLTNSDEGEDS